MGSRGPVPKRSEDRHRRNKKPESELSPVAVIGPPVVVGPEPDVEWHPIAADWYGSLADSGMARFYEASDWMTAFFIAHEMTRYLAGERQNGQVLTTILAGMTELGATEGGRRRMGIELARSAGDMSGVDVEKVEAMDRWKLRFQQGG